MDTCTTNGRINLTFSIYFFGSDAPSSLVKNGFIIFRAVDTTLCI